ncbi:MAG: c-type cytochrome [Rhodospirillales bacterium]|nr:c-type cytochrome [Rhodospirillales bacterium]
MTKVKFLAFGLATVMALASSAAFAGGDAKKGEKVFKKCKACHSMEAGKHKIGPSLAGIVGKKAGSSDFKKYKALKGADFTWDEDTISAWITNQKDFLKEKGLPTKTSMRVAIKKEDDREDVVAYLKAH